jgi:hypothetical protein
VNRSKILPHARAVVFLIGALLITLRSVMAGAQKKDDFPQIHLRAGWKLESSRVVRDGRESVSTVDSPPRAGTRSPYPQLWLPHKSQPASSRIPTSG